MIPREGETSTKTSRLAKRGGVRNVIPSEGVASTKTSQAGGKPPLFFHSCSYADAALRHHSPWNEKSPSLREGPVRFWLAERGGFEPPVHFDMYDSLANCWFKPLTHLSVSRSGPDLAKTSRKYSGG